MAVDHHTYCKPNHFQMLVGRLANALSADDGKTFKEIMQDPYYARRYGTIDILKAVDVINLAAGGNKFNMDAIANDLGLEYHALTQK